MFYLLRASFIIFLDKITVLYLQHSKAFYMPYQSQCFFYSKNVIFIMFIPCFGSVSDYNCSGKEMRKMYKISAPEAEFLDEIQTKVLRVFLLASQSPLQLCLEISIYSYSRNLLQFLLFSYCTL
jgi:hypothetical protein